MEASTTCFSFYNRGKASLILPKRAHLSKANYNSNSMKYKNGSANISTTLNSSSDPDTTRRSGNYKPTTWDYEYIQSITNDYVGEKYMKRFNKVMEETKKMMMMIKGSSQELAKLELIDNLQRLGLSYHFKDEILQILKTIHQNTLHGAANCSDSLYSAALKFRLLREYGFDISQDTLKNFMDEDGNLKQSVRKDIKGLLQLYEASFLSTETENTLKVVTRHTKSELKNYVYDENNQHSTHDEDNNNILKTLVSHALELPLHWMMLRLETRWYINNIYEKIPDANPLLLELAKLDFNIVQATHQEELRNVSRWWKRTGLAEKLPFSRDRLVEYYFWSVGIVIEAQHGYFRKMVAKNVAFITAIDDVYDVFGTLDELEAFTDAVERWDIKAMEQLPDYMKICYLALLNTANEMAYDILKEQGIYALPFFTKSWADLCKAYLQEAKWYNDGYKPTLQEYMDNASVSVAAHVVLVHAFFFVTNPITKEALESFTNVHPNIISWSATITRHVNDLASSPEELKKGDVLKSIQCYMEEKGASEEKAREHIKDLTKKTWEKMNEATQREKKNSLCCDTFIEITKNLARAAHWMYLHGDDHGIQNSEIKRSISNIFFEPIPIIPNA